MKKIIGVILSLFLLVALTGCINSSETKSLVNTFEGRVEVIEENRLTVYGLDKMFSTVYVNVSKDTKVTLQNGSKGTLEDIKENDNVRIHFNGAVASSLPPQVTAQSITIN